MPEFIMGTFYWVHLLATVTWIGGIIFILFIAIPSSRRVLGADAGKLMGDISKRFTPLANYSIVLLAASGAGLTLLNEQFSGIGFPENKWSSVLLIKLVLVLCMVVVHFYRGLILAPAVSRTTSDGRKKSLQKLSLNLVKANLVIGVLVLFLSGIMSTS